MARKFLSALSPWSSATPSLNWGWIGIGALGAVGLFWWPLLVVAGCMAISKHRGPDHYTKFMVPYAYRFKWDVGWIAIAGAVGYGYVTETWLVLGIAIFAALMRVVIWLCYRFPLMSWFFIMFIVFLFGIGIRRAFIHF
jgi:hypothetical protein